MTIRRVEERGGEGRRWGGKERRGERRGLVKGQYNEGTHEIKRIY